MSRHAAREVVIAALVVTTLTMLTLLTAGLDMPLDLTVYLRGGQSVLHGSDQVYDTPYGLLPFTYPPVAAVVFTVLAPIPPAATTIVVTTLSFAALYVLIAVAHRNIPAVAMIHPAYFVILASYMEPITATLGFGQVNLILAALVILDLLWVGPRRSGILLGIAICIKVTPAIFLLLPLLRRDWATLRRAALTAILGTLLPLLLVPKSTLFFWSAALWDPERVGGVAYLGNQSIQGAIWRASAAGGMPLLSYALDAVVLALTVYAAHHFVRRDALGAVSSIALGGLLISPISWSHHWVWVPLVVMWLLAQAAGPGRRPRLSGGTRADPGSRISAQDAAPAVLGLRLCLLVLAILWLATTLSKLIWVGPAGDDTEYSASLVIKLVSDAYTILGFASLIACALIARFNALSPLLRSGEPELAQ